MKKINIFIVLLTAVEACFLLFSTAFAHAQADITSTIKEVVILHFGDINGGDSTVFFQALKDRYNYYRTQGKKVIVIGSGDYVFLSNRQELEAFKQRVVLFQQKTGCPSGDIFLALGNHDDPARLNTATWNAVWNGSRIPENVIKNGDLIIAWMHSEQPNLSFLTRKLEEKKTLCPTCVPILIGHKPLILEPGLAQYQNFLLLNGWRQKTLALLKQFGVKLYLTGHLEIHSVLTSEGTLHNRVTPARRGFEEIVIKYYPLTGKVQNINVTTR